MGENYHQIQKHYQKTYFLRSHNGPLLLRKCVSLVRVSVACFQMSLCRSAWRRRVLYSAFGDNGTGCKKRVSRTLFSDDYTGLCTRPAGNSTENAGEFHLMSHFQKVKFYYDSISFTFGFWLFCLFGGFFGVGSLKLYNLSQTHRILSLM